MGFEESVYAKLKWVDSEIATILLFLTTEPTIEPDDIIAKADRVWRLAKERKHLVQVIKNIERHKT